MPGPGIVRFIQKWFGGQTGFNLARRNSVFQRLAADPSSPSPGDVWYNTTTNVWSGWDGTSVIRLAPTPIEILGGDLVMWLRSDLGVTTATGVSSWADQSGNGNTVVQGVGSAQPSLLPGDLDGKPGIKFSSASSQELSLIDGFSGIAAGDRPHVFIVVKSLVPAGEEGLWQLSDTSALDRVMGLQAGPTFYRARANLIAAGVQVSAAFSFTTAIVLMHETEVDTIVDRILMYRNGSLSAASFEPATGALFRTPNDLIIGALFGGANFSNSTVYEMIIANPKPTGAKLTSILQYLRDQWPTVNIITR